MNRMPMSNKLLSVVIPAYNQPERLKKCIYTIANQTYDQIEIIVSDDHSPTCLKELSNALGDELGEKVPIRYVKPPENYRPYWNILFALSHARGRYCCIMPHDDWLVDNLFFEQSVLLMQQNTPCHVAIANSYLEGTKEPMLRAIDTDWKLINGPQYVASYLFDDWHPAYSAVVFDLMKLRETSFFDLVISRKDCKYIDFDPDEGYLGVALLSIDGNVVISGRVVSIRGWLPNSYSKSKYWLENWSRGLFVVYFKLYQTLLSRGEIRCARRVRKLLLDYSLPYFDTRISEYLNNNHADDIMRLNLAKSNKF